MINQNTMKNTTPKIKLLLIEDNRILRDGMNAMFKPYSDIKILSAKGNEDRTILRIQKLKPDVILIDLGLRSQNSLRIVEKVKKEFPDSRVIVMDLLPVKGDILQFIKAGASGFILKNASLEEFLEAIREVAAGKNILPDRLTHSLFSQIIEFAVKKEKTKPKDAVRMSKREKEIILLICDALTNKEISRKLSISEFTVKSHVHNILEKLALHSRLEVANFSLTEESIKSISENISIIKE